MSNHPPYERGGGLSPAAAHLCRVIEDYDRAKEANPFVEDSEEGQTWLLGADWGSEERARLLDIIDDLQEQRSHPYGH